MLCSHVVTLKTAPLPSMDTPNKKSPTHISSVKYFFSASCQNGMPQNDYFHCCNGLCVSVLRKCWSLLYAWITLNKRSSVHGYNVKKLKEIRDFVCFAVKYDLIASLKCWEYLKTFDGGVKNGACGWILQSIWLCVGFKELKIKKCLHVVIGVKGVKTAWDISLWKLGLVLTRTNSDKDLNILL